MERNPINWNTIEIEHVVWYLELKYKYLTSVDAKCINRLIKYYKQTKDGQDIINKD